MRVSLIWTSMLRKSRLSWENSQESKDNLRVSQPESLLTTQLNIVNTTNDQIKTTTAYLIIYYYFLVINTVVEPNGQSFASKASAVSSSSGVRPSRPPASRDFRTVHSASKRGGGPRPGESIRRAAVTPDDVREGYLVWRTGSTRFKHELQHRRARCHSILHPLKPRKAEVKQRVWSL